MTWGFKGIFKRVLEFPAAAAQAALAPLGRMRMRYNDALDRGEISTNGGPWLPIATSATVSSQPGVQPMQVILQSEALAARRRIPFYLVAPDGVTPVTGLVFAGSDIQVSKNGAAFVDFAGSMTEVGQGLYSYNFAATEVDTLGFAVVKVEEATIRTAIASAQIAAYDPNAPAVGAWSQPLSAATAGTTGWSQLITLYEGAYGPGVYVDTYYPGTPGTVVGVNGTPNNPVGNLVDARTLATALGIRCYYIVGLVTLSADHQDWLFVGSGQDSGFEGIDLDDVDCFGATFIGTGLTGDFAAAENAGNVACVDCQLSGVNNIVGTLQGCTLRDPINMPTGAFSFPTLQLIDCTELAPFGSAAPSIGCGGAAPTDAQIYVSGYRGRLTFSAIADLTTIVQATFDGADVVFDATCTAAITPRLLGDFRLTNLGAVTPDVAAQTQEVVDDVLTAAHGAGPWT